MPKPKLTKAQVSKISRQCMGTFFKSLDSCLEDGFFPAEVCLQDAAREWHRCMKNHGVTIAVRTTGRARPKPRATPKPRAKANAARRPRRRT